VKLVPNSVKRLECLNRLLNCSRTADKRHVAFECPLFERGGRSNVTSRTTANGRNWPAAVGRVRRRPTHFSPLPSITLTAASKYRTAVRPLIVCRRWSYS
jgi:hypothetical protein